MRVLIVWSRSPWGINEATRQAHNCVVFMDEGTFHHEVRQRLATNNKAHHRLEKSQPGSLSLHLFQGDECGRKDPVAMVIVRGNEARAG